jgi:adenylylsulfate kinase
MVVWIIGISGSGKSAVGESLLARWKPGAPNTVLVDGDAVRAVFASIGESADHSVAGRRKNAQRTIALCEWLDHQGINVICCQLSIFEDLRAAHRQLVSSYLEVWLDTPLPIAIARDAKGIYAKALAGEARNVVGIDIPFPEPLQPDLVLDGSGSQGSAADLATRVWQAIQDRRK